MADEFLRFPPLSEKKDKTAAMNLCGFAPISCLLRREESSLPKTEMGFDLLITAKGSASKQGKLLNRLSTAKIILQNDP